MADTKITSLQPPQAGYSVVPATDVLPIVVIADPGMATSGSTRKVTVNQLLGAGGTATLASATITGDLTVGTGAFGAGQSGGLIGNGKQVVFTNNSGSNSGWISNADNACIYSSGAGGAFAFNGHLVLQPRGSAAGAILFGTGNGAAAMAERYKIDSTGISTWSVAGTTAMTLNSTGLGVGDSPATKIFARVTPPGAGQDGMRVSDGTRLIQMSISGSTYSYQGIGSNQNVIYASGNPLSILSDAQNLRLGTSSTSYLLLDTSGNVGIGVTPSASKLQVAGNIGLPNTCTASGETSGVFSIDVANLLTLSGANWRQASILLVYSGVNTDLSNPTVLQTVVTLTGLSTWNTIAKNDIVGTASVAVSNDTTTGARITVTVPTGNSGTVYAVLLGGAGATTRPSMTINA